MAKGEAAWTRDTPWRQGHVLSLETARDLELIHPAGVEATCVVVSSHDCDLANDNLIAEPNVEVIVGCLPGKANGNFTWAKSPRTLHLEAERGDGTVVIELVATEKRLVPKTTLAAFGPDATWSLSGSSLSILRSWLAVRYNRGAFPDAFVDCLKKSKVMDDLIKLIEPTHTMLSAIYFDVDSGKETDHADGSPYDLKVFLVFPPGEDPEEAADKTEALAEKIESIFAQRLFDKATDTWSGVNLKACLPISEDDLPVSQARKLTEWRFEYMSLKEEANEQRGG